MTTTTQFFRVATEGATTDGRVIDRKTIIELAKSFNPRTYGARIWLEHIRGTTPESTFKAYGDVLAVKAEEVDTASGKKMALFAQISPTPDLIAMNKARQKIYTSLEIDPDFSDTGLPYLIGLGVTDSPASLGTDILTFSAGKGANSPFAFRKHSPGNLYTEAVEINLEFGDSHAGTEQGNLAATLKNLFRKITGNEANHDSRFAELGTAIETVANVVVASDEKHVAQKARFSTRLQELEAEIKEAKASFAAFAQRIDTEDHSHDHRPRATGGNASFETDC